MAGGDGFRSLEYLVSMRRHLHWLGSAVAVIGVIFVALKLREYGGQLDLARLDGADWIGIAGLALAYGLASALLGLAWRELLAGLSVDVSAIWALKAHGISQIGKYLPGNVFHFAARQAMGMADGAPALALAKSALWELASLAATAATFGWLLLPLAVPAFPAWAAASLMLLTLAGGTYLGRRHVGAPMARAIWIYALFLAISGAMFVCLLVLVSRGGIGAASFIPVAGAYVIAWLAGLITPGAPSGLGIREMVLVLLLGTLVHEADLLLAVLLGRLVTVAGDVVLLLGALALPGAAPRPVAPP